MLRRFLLHFCTYSGLALILMGCDPCDNRILQDLPDPSGQTKAIIFQRSCGPFGGTSTQISVLPNTTDHLIAGGNVFSADTADGTAPALPSGGPPVVVTWTGPQQLSVTYDSRVRVFQAQSQMNDVSISYEARSAEVKGSRSSGSTNAKTRKTTTSDR
ncbi:MAG: hypothetical protein FJ147_13885 [Deltaproteobacteria bacterium]|nr:hypothetical protein [Deltaproteobacteria bacterium]